MKISEEETARQLAELILDMFVEEYGYLPAPPSEEEFHRIWEETMSKHFPQHHDIDTIHSPPKASVASSPEDTCEHQ